MNKTDGRGRHSTGYTQYSSVMAANSEEFHCTSAVDEARRDLAWGEGVSLMLL